MPWGKWRTERISSYFPYCCPSGLLGLLSSDGKFLLLRLLFLAEKPFSDYTRTSQGALAGCLLLFKSLEISAACSLSQEKGEASPSFVFWPCYHCLSFSKLLIINTIKCLLLVPAAIV